MIQNEELRRQHIRREREKARLLRKGSWWKQQIGPGLCYHCGQRFPLTELTMDHLVPLSRGGTSNKKNIVVSCKACNKTRGHRMQVEVVFDELEQARGQFDFHQE